MIYIPEIAITCLIIAWVSAMCLLGCGIYCWQFSTPSMHVLAKRCALTQWLLVSASFVFLMIAFISNDFSVAYVAEHSNTHLPLFYRIGGTWGAHEGSMLLWLFILTSWTAAFAYFSKAVPAQHRTQVLSVLAALSIGFVWFILATSSPFQRLLLPTPKQGLDLNALLQDPGLISHPPYVVYRLCWFLCSVCHGDCCFVSKTYA